MFLLTDLTETGYLQIKKDRELLVEKMNGLQVLIDAGIQAVVQPGGSMRDQEVIEAAQAAGITMYFTDTRHFYH